MKIIGVDPGFNATGYGVVECKKGGQALKLLETGVIEPKKNDLLQNRIASIYRNLDEIIREFKPDVMVLEKLYAHYKHPVTAAKMGHVRGAICLVCAHRNIELAEYSVKRIRSAVVGNGNATKQQTQSVVAHLLDISASQLTLDASDALALALGYINITQRYNDS